MTKPTITGFHGHVYYDVETRHIAERLRSNLELLDSVNYNSNLYVGKMHDGPIGPHTKAMFMVGFNWILQGTVFSHLMLYRNGLDVLIHPETGDELKDHTDHAIWLGNKLPLNLDKL